MSKARRRPRRITRDRFSQYEVVELICSPNPDDGVPAGDGYRARLVADDEAGDARSGQH
jgi:hypothetical protein